MNYISRIVEPIVLPGALQLSHPTLTHDGTELITTASQPPSATELTGTGPTQSLPAPGRNQVSAHETLPPFITNPWFHSLRAKAPTHKLRESEASWQM
jgi:hypothetical protein